MKLTLRPYQRDFFPKIIADWKKGIKRICVVAPCGAGKTVLFASMAAATQKNGKTVFFCVHRKELLDQTVNTFKKFDIRFDSIYVMMISQAVKDNYPQPDIVIFDECQHSMAKTWKKVIDKFPNAYYIGLTATPCRLDNKPFGDLYEDMITGITAKELIDSGYLSKYRYYAPVVTDLSALKRKGSDFDTQQAAELLMERAVFGDVIQHYKLLADGMQAICYCSSIAHSERMAEEFQKAGINAVHFDGNTPKKQRDEIIQKYRDKEISILCNVDLISEGFDCPDCECCILLRPTMSLSLYIQQAMRCMRPKEGKTAIILDHVNNVSRHGLPDDNREWSLHTVPKPSAEKHTEDGRMSIRTCTYCFGTYKANNTHECPYCHKKEILTEHEIKNIKKIHLEEIKESAKQKAAARVENYDSDKDCKTLNELMAYAKKKGYKPGWAYFQAKKRGLIR